MYFDVHTHSHNKDSKDVLSILNVHENFHQLLDDKFISLGIHPWYLNNSNDEKLAILKSLAHLPEIWAIGECGIDPNSASSNRNQVSVFQTQIAIAETFSKPLIIHCVRAFQEVLQLLNGINGIAIFHGINNKASIIQPIISAGHFLSFGKSLINPTLSIKESLCLTPLNKLLFETDDSNASIKEIYSQAAKILNIEEKILVLQIEENFKTIFPQACKI